MTIAYDPTDAFERHDREQQRWLERRPKCDICGEHIQDEYCYMIGGETVCPECLENDYRVEIED